MAKSLQSKKYMVSLLERMCMRTQHMARGVSEDGAGLHTLASLRPAQAGGGRGWYKSAGEARSGGEERRWWGLQTLAVGTKVQALRTKLY